MALKLLIIHPDEPFRRNLRERLELSSCQLFEAASQAEASEIALQHNLDVVLVAISGSSPERFALLSMIKSLRPLTEVILLSTLEEHSVESSIQAMQLGAFDDLSLPLEIPALQARILEACQRKRQRARARVQRDKP